MNKGQTVTGGLDVNIPNALSILRILLTPLFAALYLRGQTGAAVAVLLLCALTDVLDGYIARRFDMVTELGKALDPVADKLIQAAMMLCAAARTPLVWLLLAAHILRETLMAAAGLYMLRVLGQVYGAQWYGKVCTALIYAVMIALLLFPDMPEPLAAGGVFTCVFMVLMCLVMYLADYARVLRGEKR